MTAHLKGGAVALQQRDGEHFRLIMKRASASGLHYVQLWIVHAIRTRRSGLAVHHLNPVVGRHPHWRCGHHILRGAHRHHHHHHYALPAFSTRRRAHRAAPRQSHRALPKKGHLSPVLKKTSQALFTPHGGRQSRGAPNRCVALTTSCDRRSRIDAAEKGEGANRRGV